MRPTCVTCATKAMYILRACRTENRASEVFLWQHARFEFRGCRSLALAALVTGRRADVDVRMLKFLQTTITHATLKASLGAVVTRETIAERRRFGLPFLECSSELSVMAVSVQRHYFYFRPSSPTSVRVWQTRWHEPTDEERETERTPNSNYREENRQSPATTRPHPDTIGTRCCHIDRITHFDGGRGRCPLLITCEPPLQVEVTGGQTGELQSAEKAVKSACSHCKLTPSTWRERSGAEGGKGVASERLLFA